MPRGSSRADDDGVELLPSASLAGAANAAPSPAVYGRGEGAKYRRDDFAVLDGGGFGDGGETLFAASAAARRRRCRARAVVAVAVLVGVFLAALVVGLTVRAVNRHNAQTAAFAAASAAAAAAAAEPTAPQAPSLDAGGTTTPAPSPQPQQQQQQQLPQQQQQQQQQRAPVRPVSNGGCAGVRVSTQASAPPPDPTGRLSVVGTVEVVNRNEWPVAIQRVGVRLCSSVAAVGHLRAEAQCPSDEVGAKRRMTCLWSMQLPAPGPNAPGAVLSAWSGLVSSVQLTLTGDRCVSPVTNPMTGDAGSCAAGGE
jgi:hypothetical protein